MVNLVDTTKCEHRTLRFENPDQIIAEAERIAAAERVGKLKRCGNWTAGQVFGHLAAWINYAYDGNPGGKPPWIIKVILRLRKNAFMRGPLPRGVHIPKVEGGTHGREELSVDEGLAKLRAAWARLRAKAPTAPNVVLGPLTHEEWITMHTRHAELHMGYLHPV